MTPFIAQYRRLDVNQDGRLNLDDLYLIQKENREKLRKVQEMLEMRGFSEEGMFVYICTMHHGFICTCLGCRPRGVWLRRAFLDPVSTVTEAASSAPRRPPALC